MSAIKKTVLITGCSARGIGSALADAFLAADYIVFVTLRNPYKIDAAFTVKSNVHVLQLDVTSSSQIARAAQDVSALTQGKLDVLVNNAGENYTMPLLDIDMEKAKQIFEVNFWGALAVTKAFAPLLVASRGMVMNISSIAGGLNTPYMGIYSASKAALTVASETLRLELDPLNVKVLTIISGNVQTNFWSNEVFITLPEDSYYVTIKKEVEDCATGKKSGKQTDAKEYARQIVATVDAGQSGAVWKGALAGTVRWMARFMPTWMLDKALSDGRGLDMLARHRHQREKSKSTEGVT